jgi:class 3 adenylate cyclase/tetratricopeptide (TPR) repeat protein
VDTRTTPDDPVVTVPPAFGQPALNPYVPRVLLRHLALKPEELWWTIDGSVVFVDISGFTKLSEKLAKVGKEGAEQVTDAIEACFTDLLSVAYANDGSLIKFGGDALLLLFEDGDHVANACRSAVWMRRALRDVGRIELPGGAHLQLRMSVGVHTGTYNFFHVGGSHRELVVTGPGWTGTVAMEHVADAGEILLSPDIAAKLPPRCVGAPKGTGLLLKREPAGHHTSVPGVTYEVEPEAVASCLSTAVRAHVLAGGGTPEHRQVTIAFIHYDGTDGMIADQGPAFVADGLQELLAATQAACDEYGVCFLATDADDDGGKLILTAGAPTITGNDEERMLLALRKIADKERTIPIRIGVNRGAVFAGDIGPWYRRTYTVMGDAVNLAARLMAKATPGQIFATEEVIESSGTMFATTELEPFMVKGKAKPVQAWAIGEVLGSRTRNASAKLPLIGRDKELAELRAALADAAAGKGSLIEIVGEPGIGKTRLVEELHADQEARVLFAAAEAFTASTPYFVWRELLRAMLDLDWEADDRSVVRRLREVIDAADPSLEPWLPLVAIPLDVDMPMTPEVEQLDDEFRQPKLLDVMERFLTATLPTETLIHVEDAHLMDGASVDLFTHLLKVIGDRPWLMTITRRETGEGFVAPQHERAHSMRIEPLDRDGVIALVDAATEDTPLLPHNVSLVADRAGGNPQFALDLSQVVATGGMLPESIEKAAMARIDALAPADRALVRRTSVLGITFHKRYIEEVLPEGAPSPDDDTWSRLAEFFADEGEEYVRFRRAVVRDAAYTGLPFRTRRELHSRVGSRFEREFNPEESGGILSLHFFLAGEHEKAWTYARQAGARAAEHFANTEAAQLFERAIDAGKRVASVEPRSVAQAYEELGEARYRAGEYQKASAAYAAASKRIHDEPVPQARLLLRRAWVEENLGRYPQALRWLTRGLKTLDGVEGSDACGERSRLMQYYATILLAEGRPGAAVGWAERAAGEAREANDQVALARSYDSLDWANLSLGKKTGEYWRPALHIFEELGDVSGASGIALNLGAGLFHEGEWDEALESYQRAREGRLTVGDPVVAALAADNTAEIYCERGYYEEAEKLLRESLRVWRASGYRFMLGSCLEFLARVASRTGRVEEAIAMLLEARSSFEEVGAREDVLRADARVAECHVLAGDSRAALECAVEAIEIGSDAGEAAITGPLVERVRGYALAQMNEFDIAIEALNTSLETARSRSDLYEVALSAVALARVRRLAGLDGDGALVAEASETFERLGVIAVPAVLLPASPTA